MDGFQYGAALTAIYVATITTATPQPAQYASVAQPSHPRPTPTSNALHRIAYSSQQAMHRPDAATLGPQLQRFSYRNGQSVI